MKSFAFYAFVLFLPAFCACSGPTLHAEKSRAVNAPKQVKSANAAPDTLSESISKKNTADKGLSANASVVLHNENGDELTWELHGLGHEEIWFYKPARGKQVQLIPLESETNVHILVDNLGNEKGNLEIVNNRREEGFESPAEVKITFTGAKASLFTEKRL